MQFVAKLREPIRNGEITRSVRIWQRPRVKVGGRYRLGDGFVVVDAIQQIELEDISRTLARETGFSSLAELLKTARHGSGENVYLVDFHFEPAKA